PAAACARAYRARGRADAHADALEAAPARRLAAVALQAGEDAQRGADRALGVVLAGGRGAEEGEHAVPGQVLDVAAERLDLADDPCDGVADDELHVLGIESLGERGRADDVGEE